MEPLNQPPVTFRALRSRVPPTFKLWPDMAQAKDIGAPALAVPLPALRAPALPAALATFPETPPIPPAVASGDLITAVHENTVTEGISDLWIDLQWLAANAVSNPTTTKGDLIVNSGSALARLPVGADLQVLTADATLPLGLKWATPTASGSYVPTSRRVIAGAGMTGGGALTADVTLNANVISVFGRTGTVAAQPGDYTAAQVTNAVSVLGAYADPAWITSLGWGKITGTPAAFPPTAHTHDASAIVSGIMATARLGSGVANATVFLRGDGTWAAPSGGTGGGSQTPWLSDIDAAGFSLSRVSAVALTKAYAESPTMLYQSNGNGMLRLQCHSSLTDEFPVLISVPDNSGSIAFSTSGIVTPPTTPVFTERMRITYDGKVGIGTTTPTVLLSLGASVGDKVAVYDGGVGGSYGFGIQSYQFQMYCPSFARVSIGAGSSGSFTEVLTVSSNGCVGMGYSAPNDALVINGLPGSGQGQLRIVYGNYGAFLRSDGAACYFMTTASGDPFGTWTPNPPWSVAFGSNVMTIYSLSVTTNCTINGSAVLGGAVDSRAHLTASSNVGGASFGQAAIEVRETARVANTQLGIEYSPRIAFHWGSQVAAQIGMDSSGLIRTFDNPGTGYAPFACAGFTSYGNIAATGLISANASIYFSGALYGNGKAVVETNDSYIRFNQSGQFASGIWLGVSFLGMSSNTLAIGSLGAGGCINLSATTADGVNRITIDGNANANSFFCTGGKVGINTVAPSSFLSILGAPASLATTNQQVSIGETGNNPDYRMTLSYVVLNGTWTSAIQSWAGGVGNVLAVNPRGGSIGMGTDKPQGVVQITPATNASSVNNAVTFLIGEQTNTAGYYTAHGMFHDGANWNHSINAWSGGAAGILLLNAAGGRVRVGSAAAPGYALDVTGDVNCSGTFRVNGAPFAGYTNPVQHVVTGSAALNVVYQNNSGRTMTISVSVGIGPSNFANVYVDGGANPTTLVAVASNIGSATKVSVLTFCVQPGYYYKVIASAASISAWVEWY